MGPSLPRGLPRSSHVGDQVFGVQRQHQDHQGDKEPVHGPLADPPVDPAAADAAADAARRHPDQGRRGDGRDVPRGETVEQDDFLSNIIEELNNKIGLKLDSKTLIPYIKNIKEQLMADEQLKNAARQNEECDFATVYYNKIEAIFVQELKNLYGVGDNSKVEGLSKKEKEDRIEFTRAMMNVEMRRRIFGMYLDEVHQKMREEKE